MTRGTNIEETRAYNRRAVMQTLHRRGTASRSEIARLTSLSLQAVSNIMQELEQDGLVVARGRRTTGRGQPPIDYAVNPEGAFSIGLSVDSDHISGLLLGATGTVIASHRFDVDAHDPQRALPLLAKMAGDLRDRIPPHLAARLTGITLGVPGVVEEEGGVIARMVRLDAWEGMDVGAKLSQELAARVYVANDAVLAALGERWFGTGRDADTFFYVLFALGVGSSLILDGEPYGGPWGHRGRLGHIPVEPGGERCPSCGGSGCLSLYTSLGALLERLAAAGVEGRSGEELVSLHAQRNAELVAWIDSAAHYLARGLVVLENLLAPNVVVFGGRLPRPILTELIELADVNYQRDRTPLRPQAVRLLLGQDDNDAVTIGAAALPHYLLTAADYRLVQRS